MPTASITPPGPILSASVTLTSAQVLAIFTTPVTVVPAPGAGLQAIPLAAVYDYTFVSTAYTDNGGNLGIKTGGSALFGSFDFATSTFWTATASRIVTRIGNLNTGATNPNLSLVVQQDTANPTLGNGTVTVTVAYMVVPVS